MLRLSDCHPAPMSKVQCLAAAMPCPPSMPSIRFGAKQEDVRSFTPSPATFREGRLTLPVVKVQVQLSVGIGERIRGSLVWTCHHYAPLGRIRSISWSMRSQKCFSKQRGKHWPCGGSISFCKCWFTSTTICFKRVIYFFMVKVL